MYGSRAREGRSFSKVFATLNTGGADVEKNIDVKTSSIYNVKKGYNLS